MTLWTRKPIFVQMREISLGPIDTRDGPSDS